MPILRSTYPSPAFTPMARQRQRMCYGASAIASYVRRSTCGETTAAIVPYVKAPSALIGIGNGAVEGGLTGPVAFNLPNSFVLLLAPEIDVLKDSLNDAYHGNYVFDVNLSREVIKNVTAYVELWSDYNADPTAKATLMSFDTALAWVFVPNVQIDVGANFGLTGATPAVQIYAGLSQRF